MSLVSLGLEKPFSLMSGEIPDFTGSGVPVVHFTCPPEFVKNKSVNSVRSGVPSVPFTCTPEFIKNKSVNPVSAERNDVGGVGGVGGAPVVSAELQPWGADSDWRWGRQGGTGGRLLPLSGPEQDLQ